ncbi:MAG: xanthine phosphoribosyltransferase [Alphaproteobacteria bacterium]|nr:xanthine phosphoribosyltransferase [Alphaproteobacteria bacterium]
MNYNAEKFVTWDEIQGRCLELARQILQTGKTYKKILVITRGGMFPAGILARELDIRHIETVCIDTYDSQTRGEPVLLKEPAADYTKNVLVVDDLVDTGATLTMLRGMLTDSLVVTIFAKPEGEALVDLYHEKIEQNIWVRFPWDTYRQYVKPLAHEVRPASGD